MSAAFFLLTLFAQDPTDAELAVKKLRVAPGLKVTLFASEPQLVNPVCFDIDDRGRFFVVETHRLGTSVYDIRRYMSWLEDDLASRTVEDRVRMYRKQMGKDADKLAVESERIRLIEDRSGTGRADHAETFAEGFNTMADGLAAGILVRGDQAWFANIPNLWLLSDTKGDGRADLRRVLHTGYGVHMNYIGHDLHGLTWGPDGRLYFSIGDRGLRVETAGRVIDNPDSGAVLRCNPDGSDLELVATGLRNPQSLAFDQHGNLFTWDNNSDWHDVARFVYVVDGLDGGWRIGYQFHPTRGPWEEEKIWEKDANVPYRLPPVANLDHGPSGIAFNPGTGLPPRYDNHFLLCNFPGGVNSWAVEPRGASFGVVDVGEFLWNAWATDVRFGPDGAVYVSDWGEGWSMKGVGRIYRVTDPTLAGSAAVLEVKALLAGGMSKREPDELARLLGHPDQRVRLRAQFELASRGATQLLTEVVGQSDTRLARLHAIWALGQIGASEAVARFLGNADSEVRAQAAKVLGDRRFGGAHEALEKAMDDPSPRVRFFATMAIGRIGWKGAFGHVVDLLRANDDRDAYLRHAGVMALASFGDVDAILALAKDPSAPVRMGALLALRRLARPEIKAFLADSDAAIVYEAARAIHDVPIPGAMAALATLLDNQGVPPHLASRVIDACARVGTEQSAGQLSWVARRHDFPAAVRAEALKALVEWDAPPARDRVLGLHRPYKPADPNAGRAAIRGSIEQLLKDTVEVVQLEAIRAEARFKWDEALPLLVDLVRDGRNVAAARVEALRALAAMGQGREAVKQALEDPDVALRREAIRLAPSVNLPETVPLLANLALARDGAIPVRQAAIDALAAMGADELLKRLADAPLPAGVQLEVDEALAKRSLPRRNLPDAALLEGGSAVAGRDLFSGPSTGCVKCHKVRSGGGTVGPDLTLVASRLAREKLLESIVNPNAEITKGYEQVLVQLGSGDVKSGRVERETERELVLMDSEGRIETLLKSDVRARKAGKSAMPEDYAKLAKRDLRDLVAYLSTLKAVDPKTLPVEPGAVIVDDEDPRAFRTEGNWRTDRVGGDYGSLSHWSFPDATGRSKAIWAASLKPGRYRVYAWIPADPLGEHATDAPFAIGDQAVKVDLTKETSSWHLLGTFAFGEKAEVILSNNANRNVYGDAIKFVPE
jgi:quinoprotein glucose dehydrogenase